MTLLLQVPAVLPLALITHSIIVFCINQGQAYPQPVFNPFALRQGDDSNEPRSHRAYKAVILLLGR